MFIHVSLQPDELRILMDKWDKLVDEIDVVRKTERKRIKQDKKDKETRYKKPFKYSPKKGRFYWLPYAVCYNLGANVHSWLLLT